MTSAKIHGLGVEYDPNLEYGLYFSDILGFQKYSILNIEESAELLNNFNKNESIKMAGVLRDTAKSQIGWKFTPKNIGYPILISNQESVPIEDVRKNIENTKLFAENLIKVLSGK